MRGKKKHIHSFVLLFRWTTEYDQDPVNPYLRQRFLPIDQALAKRANLPEEQLWHVSFSQLAWTLTSWAVLHGYMYGFILVSPTNSISCKNFGESVTLTSTKRSGEDGMKDFTDPGQQKSPKDRQEHKEKF